MPALSIIIPCHNEEKRIPSEHLFSFLNTCTDTRIIFVNDGSTDKTAEIISRLSARMPLRILSINLPLKSGKAEAVRVGLMESVSDPAFSHHGFIDADMAITPEELYRLYLVTIRSDFKYILGSRIKKIGANIKRNFWRHFFGRLIATLVDSFTKLGVYDTQCSAKLFTSEVIKPVFGSKFHTKWLFDVELICRLKKHYGNLNQYGTEEPVLDWSEKKGSKLKWFHFPEISREILVLYRNYSSKK